MQSKAHTAGFRYILPVPCFASPLTLLLEVLLAMAETTSLSTKSPTVDDGHSILQTCCPNRPELRKQMRCSCRTADWWVRPAHQPAESRDSHKSHVCIQKNRGAKDRKVSVASQGQVSTS